MPIPVSRTSSQTLPMAAPMRRVIEPVSVNLMALRMRLDRIRSSLSESRYAGRHFTVPDIVQLQPLALDHVLEGRSDVPDQFLQIGIPQPQLHLARFELGKIQHLVDHVQQLQAVYIDLPEQSQMLWLQGPDVPLVQALHRRQDRGERGAHLMADVGEELGLQHVQLLELLVGLGQVVAPGELPEAHSCGKMCADNRKSHRD